MGHILLILFGAIFLTNCIPHLTNGLSGRAFQSPFAKPMGEGLSSSITNVLWGSANLALGWALLVYWGGANLGDVGDTATAMVGLLVMGLLLAGSFGRFNGGNRP